MEAVLRAYRAVEPRYAQLMVDKEIPTIGMREVAVQAAAGHRHMH